MAMANATLRESVRKPPRVGKVFLVTLASCPILLGGETVVAQGTLSEANTYHVSVSGNDRASGGEASPWRSIQHAADSVSPGDRVLIHGGTYPDRVFFRISGTAQAPLLFSSAPGAAVTVRALELAKGSAHLTVANLNVEGFKNWGVSLEGNNHHVTLRGLTVKGGEAGIHFTVGDSGSAPENGHVSDVTVEDTRIQGPMYTALDCTPGPCDRMMLRHLEITGAGGAAEANWGADGLAIERGQNIIVEDCYIHDNSGDGIDLNSRNRVGHVFGVIVKRNRVVRNRLNGIKLWAGGRIEGNIVWGQGDAAVILGDWPGAYEVVNNTIAYNMWDPGYSSRNWALVAAYPGEDTGVSPKMDLTLRNNIFAFNSSDALGGPTGIYLGSGVRLVDEGNNLYWSGDDHEITAEFVAPEREFSRLEIAGGEWVSSTGQGAGNVTADPLFVAGWPDVDVRLRENSPAFAIKAGATVGAFAAGVRSDLGIAN
jgi:hypothetical protein